MSENFNPDEWRRQRRTEFRDRKDAQFYIFCEGEKTELLDRAEKYVKENGVIKGQVWCVYDLDSFNREDFDITEPNT